MKQFLSILAIAFLLALPVMANDQIAQVTTQVTARPDEPQPTVDTAQVDAPSLELPALEMKEATLKDGTKISIEGENVFVVSDDGTKTPAPDGTHELADGSTLTTKGGKLLGE